MAHVSARRDLALANRYEMNIYFSELHAVVTLTVKH